MLMGIRLLRLATRHPLEVFQKALDIGLEICKWVDGPLRVEYFIIEDFIERIERWRG